MKHRGVGAMESGVGVASYTLHLDELLDLDAWEGYEFWSAQLEAELLTDPKQAEQAYIELSERKTDALPF
jgi:hypothetical protein